MDAGAQSRDAYALALQHGGDQRAIDALRTRETLLQILIEANVSEDVCEDVADTCELTNLNALAIASGLVTIDDIANLCFLTKDEAEVVSTNCAHKAFAMGVTFGRDKVVSPRRLGTYRRESPRPAGPIADAYSAADASGPFSDSLQFDSPAKHVSSKSTRRGGTSPAIDARLPKPVASTAGGGGRSKNGTSSPGSLPIPASVPAQQAGALNASPASRLHDPVPQPEQASGGPRVSGSGESPAVRKRSDDGASKATSAKVPSAGSSRPTSTNGVLPNIYQSTPEGSPHVPNIATPHPPTPVAVEVPPASTPSASAAQSTASVPSAPTGHANITPHMGVKPVLEPSTADHTSSKTAVPPISLVAPVSPSSSIPSSQATSKAHQHTNLSSESVPDSPHTPNDVRTRETLPLESGQLHTGSSVQHPAAPVAPAPVPVQARPSPTTRAAAAPSRPSPSATGHTVPAYRSPVPPLAVPSGSSARPVSAPIHASATQNRSPRITPRPRTPVGGARRATPSEALEELGSTFLKYPGVLPHFMRPTAAHEMRLKGEPSEDRTPSPVPVRRQRTVAPTAHFIKPTACYDAKLGAGPESAPPMTRARSAHVPSTRSHTPTAFAPFRLHTDMRLPQKNAMSTDELRIAELKKQKDEEAAKRREQLKRLNLRARTASPDNSARGRKTKPFQLASVARHERELQARQALQKRQEQEEARAKKFRARPFDPNQFKDVGVRQKRVSEPNGARKVTKPKGPSFLSDDRLGYRRDVLEGRFADTHEAYRVARAESMSRREERKLDLERQNTKEREFKARPAPSSSNRFKLDASKVKPTTIPKPFALSSSKTVNSVHSEDMGRERHVQQGSQVPMRICSPQGVITEFQRSLRV